MNPKDIFDNYQSNIFNKYGDYTWVTTTPSKSITIDDVLDKFTPEQLIDAIGVDKVQNILRNKKLNILKKKLNK